MNLHSRTSIYLVNPRSAHASYTGGEVYDHFGRRPAAMMADLTLPTVAAHLPPSFDVTLWDEALGDADPTPEARFVGLTAKVNQWPRARALADHYRARGKVVVFGGSFATLSPDTVRPHCDVLVRGELEGIAEELFTDLERGCWRSEYVGDRPELNRTVIPRWDLYPNARAAMGTVQTSRGCPFECEFCDVIAYLGRKQRHKPIGAVLEELQVAYAHGYRRVMLADDNLTVHRAHARELLAAIRDWNDARVHGRMEFLTQVSIEIADDPELLRLMADAGIVTVFIGLETSNPEALREVKKRQNLRDLRLATETIVAHGIGISAGIVVGFDHDTPDVFAQQLAFMQSTPIPHFTLALLVAPEGTPLHERLSAAGRLRPGAECIASPLETNVVPLGMTPDQLTSGMRWLCSEAFDPRRTEARLMRFLELFGRSHTPMPPNPGVGVPRDIDLESTQLLADIAALGPDEERMLRSVQRALGERPAAKSAIGVQLLSWLHARCLFEREGLIDARGRLALN